MRKFENIFKGDRVIWMVFFLLCIISIIEVYSASSQLSYKSGNFVAPMLKHICILIVGITVMIITLHVKCQYFKIMTPFLLLFSVLTLIIVLIIGQTTNGASRWISFLGIQFQPSEIAKGALVLATAQILSAMQTDKGADKTAMKFILIISVPIIALIASENLSTAMLLCCVVGMMMIIGRVPMVQIGKLLGIVVGFIAIVIIMVMTLGVTDQPKDETQATETELVAEKKAEEGMSLKVFHRFGTWKSRINSFLNKKDIPPEEVDLDKDAQTAQANIAIATSDFHGKGPGNSRARDFLPQAFSDFIYAIIIEELGIFGAVLVAFLYVILLIRTGIIAGRCENTFPAYLAMGLALLLVTQALFNMCVAVGLAPVTGQPLPLISKGGTSTIINCFYLGIILSISRTAKRKDNSIEENQNAQVALA